MNTSQRELKEAKKSFKMRYRDFLTRLLLVIAIAVTVSWAEANTLSDRGQTRTDTVASAAPTFCETWIYYRDYNMMKVFNKAYYQYVLSVEGASDLRKIINQLKEDTTTWYGINASSKKALGIGMFAQSIKLATDLLKDAASAVDKRAKHMNTASKFVECQALKVVNEAPLSGHSIEKCIAEVAVEQYLKGRAKKATGKLLKQYNDAAWIYAKMKKNLYKLVTMPDDHQNLKDEVGKLLRSLTNRLEQYEQRMYVIEPSIESLNWLVIKLNALCRDQSDTDKALEAIYAGTSQETESYRNQTYANGNSTSGLNDPHNDFAAVVDRIDAAHSKKRSDLLLSANNISHKYSPIGGYQTSGNGSKTKISIRQDTCQADDGNGEVGAAIQNGLNQGYSIDSMISLTRQQIEAYRQNLNALDLRYEEHRKIKPVYEESIAVNQAVIDALECMKRNGLSAHGNTSAYSDGIGKEALDGKSGQNYPGFEPKMAPIKENFSDYCGIGEACSDRKMEQLRVRQIHGQVVPASRRTQRGIR